MSRFLGNDPRARQVTPSLDLRDGAPGLAVDAGIAFGALLIGKLAGAAGGALAARVLGPHDRGSYAVYFTVATTIGSVAGLGLDVWAGSRLPSLGLSAVRSVLDRQMLMVVAVVSVGGSAVALAFAPGGSGAMNVAVASVLAMVTTAFMFGTTLAVSLRQMAGYARANLSSNVVYLLTAAVLWALDAGSVLLFLGGAALAKLVAVALLPDSVRSVPRWRRDGPADHYRGGLRFGLPASVGNLIQLAAYRVDVLFVAWLAGTTDAGYYAAALAVTEFLWLVPNAISHVLLPAVARDSEAAAHRTALCVRVTTAVLLVGLGVLIASRNVLIAVLFGDAFLPAAAAVLPLAVAAVAMGAWQLLTADLLARGFGGARAATAGVGVAVMILLDVVLIPRSGITGAGAATAAGYSVSLLLAVVLWRRHARRSAMELVQFSARDFAAVRTALRRRSAR